MNDKDFRIWEDKWFGYGYGSGEKPVLKALKQFVELLEDGRKYDHEEMEKKMGKQVFWLVLNVMCHSDFIEYGTSPRYGWLTQDKGGPFAEYIKSRSVDELYEVLFTYDCESCRDLDCSCCESK